MDSSADFAIGGIGSAWSVLLVLTQNRSSTAYSTFAEGERAGSAERGGLARGIPGWSIASHWPVWGHILYINIREWYAVEAPFKDVFGHF